MKIGIMQPYFLPYIGYFQLISVTDIFVVYDNIKYTKKGWINRNRYLASGDDAIFSVPLKKDSDSLDVVEREISDTFDRQKLLNQISAAYAKAPYFRETFPAFERIVRHQESNLFDFILNSIRVVNEELGIKTKLVRSSSLKIDHSLKAQDKVLAICGSVGADHYINPIGGVELYDKGAFLGRNFKLSFLKTRPIEYPQFAGPFVPWLSILDVMMFNSRKQISDWLSEAYDLI